MVLKKIIFSIIILAIIGFGFIWLDKKSGAGNEETSLYQAKFLFSDSDHVASFECEDFASNALNNYTIASIHETFLHILRCTQEPMHNKHDSLVIDTIYTFSNPENQIQIYRAQQNDFVFTFDVTDPIFILAGDIRPGITKEEFSRTFHITETIGNQVQIANNEASMRFMFYFENNLLKRINSYLYLD